MVRSDFDIRDARGLEDIVDCIEEGTYGEAPKNLISFLDTLPQTPAMNFLRTLTVPFLL